MKRFFVFAAVLVACGRHTSAPQISGASSPPTSASSSALSAASSSSPSPSFPLELVGDVPLPGGATRFDYQDIDVANGHLVLAHMNDASVLLLNVADGSVAKLLPNIPTPRGVAVGDDRIFVTSSPSKLVIVDGKTLAEIARVPTGNGPDGVAYDPADRVVGVSDQHDGAVSLIGEKGSGQRFQLPLGKETGNVIFDAARGAFWAAVVGSKPPDQLVRIDPIGRKVTTRIDLPGCEGAHGVRLHPDGQSAFVACEDNDMLARVDLDDAHGARSLIAISPTGKGPDVMSIDPGLGFLYVAAESGDLVVFDIHKPGLVAIDREHPGDHAHSVTVDPATHRVFFPLQAGPGGKPAMRIMRPKLEPASERAWSFDSDKAGASPSGFVFGRTGNGRDGNWVVRSEADAPSGPNVLAQLDADATDYRFPVAFSADSLPADVEVGVKCKPVSGKVDEACGLVFRLKDASNYYLTRANALEGNVRLYFVKGGQRQQIATWSGKVSAGAWHELRVVARGDHFEVSWDGSKVIDHHDATFAEGGRVGAWTKADSVTYFDDLRARPL